jgi:hypothetical protein
VGGSVRFDESFTECLIPNTSILRSTQLVVVARMVMEAILKFNAGHAIGKDYAIL